VFFVWGGCCFICIFFVWAMIYETKGLSLEQVDELYAKVGKAWHSKGFVPTVSFQEVQDAVGVEGARKMSLVEAEEATMRRKSTVGQHEYAEKPQV
jgi:SP family sugar:H+ symporter-like MFS transporter